MNIEFSPFVASAKSKVRLDNFSKSSGKPSYTATPAKVEEVLKADAQVKYLADIFKDARNFLYLGRGFNFPVALEGALKLKEISYIHAEGYPAAEMKHGPIALIDDKLPVIIIATKDSYYEKIVSKIQEIKARKVKLIAIISVGLKLAIFLLCSSTFLVS